MVSLVIGPLFGSPATDEFEFNGKFIMICNSFPETPDGEAIRSRSFLRPIQINSIEAKRLLREAASDKTWYEDTKIAKAVAEFLVERLNDSSVWKISYRMLQIGYELAKDHPQDWQDLLAPKIPQAERDPSKLVKKLDRQKLKVKEQVRIFEEETGMSRRTFFKYRRDANLTRPD